MTELAALNVRIAGDTDQLKASLNQSTRDLERFGKSAAKSASVFEKAFAKNERALESLRRSLDPVYASSKRYEAAVETLNTALQQGALSQKEHSRLIERAGQSYLSAGRAAGTAGKMAGGAGTNGFRMLTMQLNQVGQMGAVTGNYLQALAIQIPDMALGFGTLGTVIGAVAAFALPSLISAISGASNEVKDLDKAIEDTTSQVRALESAIDQLGTPMHELIEQFGLGAFRVREMNEALVKLETIKSLDAISEAARSLSSELAPLTRQLNEVLFAQGGAGGRDAALYEQRLRKLREEFGLTQDQALEVVKAMQRLSEADGPQQQAAAAKALADALLVARNEAGVLPEALRAAAESAINLSLEAQKLDALMRQTKATTQSLFSNIPGSDWLAGPIAGVQALLAPLARALQLKGALFGTSGAIDYEPSTLQGGRSAGVGGATAQEIQKHNPFAQLAYSNTGDGASGGAAGGGGAQSNPLQQELAALQQSLMTAEQLEIESFQRRQQVLNDALQQRLITTQEYARMMEKVEASHQFAMTQSVNKGVSSALGALGQLFQGSKEIGAGIALANAWLAFSEVLKDPAYAGRPWARFAAAAKALATGLSAVRGIQSASKGGASAGSAGAASVGGTAARQPTSQNVAIQLTGGDMFSRDQVIQLINSINEAVDDGAVVRVV